MNNSDKMKKIFLFLTFVICSVGYIHAQKFKVIDADTYIRSENDLIAGYSTFKDGFFQVGLNADQANRYEGIVNKIQGFVVPIKYADIYNAGEEMIGLYDMPNPYWNFSEANLSICDYHGNIIISGIRSKGKTYPKFANGKMVVQTSKGECVVINKEGNIIKKFKRTDVVGYLKEGVYIIQSNNREKLINENEEIILDKDYLYIRRINDDVFYGEISADKYEIIGNNWAKLIKGKQLECSSYDKDFILIHVAGKGYGVMNNNGEMVLPTKFDKIFNFQNGLARIKKGKKYGYVNTEFKIVIPIQYNKAEDFSYGLANTDKGVIDTTGKNIFNDEQSKVGKLCEGLRWVYVNGKYGYINEKGNMVIEPQYHFANDFKNGYANIRESENYWQMRNLIDKNGKKIIQVDSIRKYYIYNCNFSENCFPFYDRQTSKYGYMNDKCEIVILPQFGDARPFYNGMAAVLVSGDWGYINHEGAIIIKPQYKEVSSFNNGYAEVKKGDKYALIDMKGEVVTPWIELGFQYAFWEGGAFNAEEPINSRFNSRAICLQINENYRDPVLIAQKDTAKEQQKPKTKLERYIEKGMEAYALPSMSDYIKPKVEKEINTWQKKDEFESTAKWKVRVNEQTRNAKIETLKAKYKKEYQDKVDDYKARCNALVKEFYTMKEKEKRDAINLDRLKLSLFDADNESFMITGLPDADILLSVKTEEAPNFKQRWETIKKTATFKYVPNGDQVTLVSVTFTNGQKKYTYDGKSNVKYGVTDVEYNFKPFELAMEKNIEFSFDALEETPKTTVHSLAQNKTKVEHMKVSVGSVSDVDKTIPNTYTYNSNTFAVIIGNENYQKVSKVQFASNDASIFAQYCKLTLGLPEKNVRYYNDATYATMLSAVKDIKSIAQAYKGNLNILFYYAGHGVPNERSNDAYLLPIDTDGQSTEVCYPLSKLYQELGSMNAKSVVVFMDACFSGAQRGEGMLASARGVAIKAKPAAPQGNMVVFSAASGDETAYPYKEKNHGLFTYFLLKKLQETKGAVTLGELGSYIMDKVTKESVVSNGKSQTPTVSTSMSLDEGWRELKLK